jgi:hypothetical protein
MALISPGINSKTFYAGKTISEVEWWISSCCKFPELCWGRLRVFSDGTVDVGFDDVDAYGFEDRKYAANFLGEDEYIRLTRMDAQDEENIGAKVGELTRPTWRDTPVRFHYYGIY